MIGILCLSSIKNLSLFLSNGCLHLNETISIDNIALDVRLHLLQILDAILQTGCVFADAVIYGCSVEQGLFGVFRLLVDDRGIKGDGLLRVTFLEGLCCNYHLNILSIHDDTKTSLK